MEKRIPIFLRTQDDLRGDMKTSSESLRIYITVDSTKIVRCQWCGVAQSEHWHRARNGIFCSRNCSHAVNPYCDIVAVVLLWITYSPLVLFLPAGYNVIGMLAIILVLSPCLIPVKGGLDHRKKVPRNSRRDDVASDMALLKAISSRVSCPKCGANINLRKVGEDRVYNCEYCGASGTIELVKTR